MTRLVLLPVAHCVTQPQVLHLCAAVNSSDGYRRPRQEVLIAFIYLFIVGLLWQPVRTYNRAPTE